MRRERQPWSDAESETVERLWSQGISVRKIGKRIGRTTGQVSGLIHRKGFVCKTKQANRADETARRIEARKAAPAKPHTGGEAAWPEEWVSALRTLHATGKSHSQIASELQRHFGQEFTASKVSGKCKRIGLKRAPDAAAVTAKLTSRLQAAAAPSPRAPRQDTASQSQNSRFYLPPSKVAPAKPRGWPADCPAPPDCPPIAILELTSKTCRWPLERNEDGDRLFCGGAVGKLDRHRRYCDHHRYRELRRVVS